MGLRSRLKQRVRRIFGPSEASAPPSTPARPAPQPVVEPAPPPPAPRVVEARPPSAPADDKVARHFERTRRAVLRFIEDQGGSAELAGMHDYSERRYFIGHKRFSDLMESLVDEALVDYDHAAGVAHLTDAGRTLAHTPMPKKKAQPASAR